MPRNPLIEAIHAARYDLETCARQDRDSCLRKLNELLQQALDRADCKETPEQLLDALFNDYRDFKRGRKREEWARLKGGS